MRWLGLRMHFQLMENTLRSREILTPAHGKQYFVSSEALPCYSKREKQPPNTLFLFPFQLRGHPGWQDFHTDSTSPGCGFRSCWQDVWVETGHEPLPILKSRAHVCIQVHNWNIH